MVAGKLNFEYFRYLCITKIKMLFVVRNRRSSAYDILCVMHKISQFLNDLMTFYFRNLVPKQFKYVIPIGTDELLCGTFNTLII